MSAEVSVSRGVSELSMLADTARQWVAEHGTVRPTHIYDRAARAAHWAAIAELGWAGVAIGEELGGAGLGMVGVGALLTALGRELVAVPLLSSGLLTAHAIGHASPTSDRNRLLAQLAAGKSVGAVALEELAPMRGHSPISARAVPSGWSLSGSVPFVLDGTFADFVLIAAQAEEPALFLVERTLLDARQLDVIDGRDYARLELRDIVVPREARLDGGPALIERLGDLARIGLAAEMTGACERAIEITVDYLKTREQFGQKIGSFQALQHRAAQMVVDLELARSCVDAAWSAADGGRAIRELAVLAKYMAGTALHRASNEIVQMHGGIGMTEAHVAGRYLKWARVSEALYGNGDRLADRYASLNGY
jgi:alkylation response protein AidB-like acyl-CoA dehydrogenase